MWTSICKRLGWGVIVLAFSGCSREVRSPSATGEEDAAAYHERMKELNRQAL